MATIGTVNLVTSFIPINHNRTVWALTTVIVLIYSDDIIHNNLPVL